MTHPILVISGLIACIGLAPQSQAQFAYETATSLSMDNPHDLKLSPDGRYLLVSDTGNSRVLILDPDTLAYVAEFGGDHQSGTHDIDFDRQGKAYVADTHNNRVLVYGLDDTTAKLEGEFKGDFRGPEGILVHSNGRHYVAGAWSHNVVAYENGQIVARLGGLSSPHDLEEAPDGMIWLADAGNDRMLLLTPDLKTKSELKGPPYDFNGVRYQDVLADGTLVVADKYTHSIKVISVDGALLCTLGSGEPALGPQKFRTPEGVEIRDNTLWISDSGNDRVVKYRVDWKDCYQQ